MSKKKYISYGNKFTELSKQRSSDCERAKQRSDRKKSMTAERPLQPKS